MKHVLIIITFITTFLSIQLVHAQDIQILTHGMTKYEPVGTYEIAIYFEVVNISADTQIVFEVRTIDDMPSGWTSSLCFGENCFISEVDSVATTPDFNTPPVAPGDTLETSIHVFTDQVSIATAHVQIEVGTFSNPALRYVLDFTATTDPSVGVKEVDFLNSYYLFQNYPNPFNPSTRISYNVGEPGLVQLKVFNVLGVEVASLVNEFKNTGNYSVDFNAANYSSGVYFYSLSVNNFTQTRKMILEK
jgi:hypothetical protein